MPKLAERSDIGVGPPNHSHPQEDPEYRKISMNLETTDLVELKRWAADERTTVSDLFRRALVLMRYLATEQLRGSTIIIRTPRGEKDKTLRSLRSAQGLTIDLD